MKKIEIGAAVLAVLFVAVILIHMWAWYHYASSGDMPDRQGMTLLTYTGYLRGIPALIVHIAMAVWCKTLAVRYHRSQGRWPLFGFLFGLVGPLLFYGGLLVERARMTERRPAPPDALNTWAALAFTLTLLLWLALPALRVGAVGWATGHAWSSAQMDTLFTVLRGLPILAVQIGFAVWLHRLAADAKRHPFAWSFFGLCLGPVAAILYVLLPGASDRRA